MLVGVEGERLAVLLQIALRRLEIVKGALGGDEAKKQEEAGGIVQEHQKRARRRPILKPAVLAAVDLDQFTQAIPAMPRLMHSSHPVLAPDPQAVGDHPLAQGLDPDPQAMTFCKLLGRQCWTEVSIVLPHEPQNRRAKRLTMAVVAWLSAFAGHQTRRPFVLKAPQEPVDLSTAEPEFSRGILHADPPVLQADQCV